MNKAIEILNEALKECGKSGNLAIDYYITLAIKELQTYKAKMEEVEDKYKQLKNKHDLICHDDCEHLCCLESGECYCEEQDCIRNYNDPSLYIDIYKDKYKQRN